MEKFDIKDLRKLTKEQLIHLIEQGVFTKSLLLDAIKKQKDFPCFTCRSITIRLGII